MQYENFPAINLKFPADSVKIIEIDLCTLCMKNIAVLYKSNVNKSTFLIDLR